MGTKLLWLGLTILETTRILTHIPDADVVGAIIMVIGLILYLLDH